MKKVSFYLLAILLMLSFTFSSVHNVEAAASFNDVSNNHWAKKEIDYLTNLGVIKGYSNGTFKPNNSVTNAQVAIMLVRTLKLDTNGRPNPGLTDVSSTHHAYKEIATAVDEGIFPKQSRFNPESPISREAMARALANAFKLEGDGGVFFSDVAPSYWAYPYIMKIAENNITTGYGDGTFKPKNTVTRAQFSAFVTRSVNHSFKPNPAQRSITGGLKLDPRKTYVYESYEDGYSYGEETWYYTGTDYGWDDWTVVRGYNDNGYYSYFEDKARMALGWQDSEIAFDIPYPLTLNKKWSFQLYEGEDVQHYVVTSVTKTITTPAGTFDNVVEVKNYDGYYDYYVQGLGLILSVDATRQPVEKTYELVEVY